MVHIHKWPTTNMRDLLRISVNAGLWDNKQVWKDTTDVMTFYLVEDIKPNKMVKDKGFKWLLKIVDPCYNSILCKTVHKMQKVQ